jgi:uncharacterized protein (TIGR03437 family)
MLVLPLMGWAQVRPEWRHVGTSAVELGLADLATGPVVRTWYAGDGLHILTAYGRGYTTSDYATWQTSSEAVPERSTVAAGVNPEPGAQVRTALRDARRSYAFGHYVYRSDDGGRHWENLTGDRRGSIVGDHLQDLAISPSNPDEVTVVGGAGVFRTVDGGRSWHGLNETLPNLPGGRLRSIPPGDGGLRLVLAGNIVLRWAAGEGRAWAVAADTAEQGEQALRSYLSIEFGTDVTAVAAVGGYVYAGDRNGRVSVSNDNLRTWVHSPDPRRGPVTALWADVADPRMAFATFGAGRGRTLEPQTVLHSINGGLTWDTVSSNLPEVGVNGLTVDAASNAVYVATEPGVYLANVSIRNLGAVPRWTRVAGLPQGAAVRDVRLDAGQTQLWASVDGFGVYATRAPHRASDPKVVSAGDLLSRAVAPGSVVSVVGAEVNSATAGGLNAPVLYASDGEAQIQLPYNLPSQSVALSISGPQGRRDFPPLPVATVAPSIFVIDGTAVLRDADRGERLDTSNPARSHMRVQIMASGLGQVRPEWPAGVPAPVERTPNVIAPVGVYFNNEPVRVLRAVLWPEYTGVYMVEVELPTVFETGLADLYIVVGGVESNHVETYAESAR